MASSHTSSRHHLGNSCGCIRSWMGRIFWSAGDHHYRSRHSVLRCCVVPAHGNMGHSLKHNNGLPSRGKWDGGTPPQTPQGSSPCSRPRRWKSMVLASPSSSSRHQDHGETGCRRRPSGSGLRRRHCCAWLPPLLNKLVRRRHAAREASCSSQSSNGSREATANPDINSSSTEGTDSN